MSEPTTQEILTLPEDVTRQDISLAIQLLANLPFEIEDICIHHCEVYGMLPSRTSMRELQAQYLDHHNAKQLADLAEEMFRFSEVEKTKP